MKHNNCPNYIIFLPKNVPIFLVFLSEFDVMFDDEIGLIWIFDDDDLDDWGLIGDWWILDNIVMVMLMIMMTSKNLDLTGCLRGNNTRMPNKHFLFFFFFFYFFFLSNILYESTSMFPQIGQQTQPTSHPLLLLPSTTESPQQLWTLNSNSNRNQSFKTMQMGTWFTNPAIFFIIDVRDIFQKYKNIKKKKKRKPKFFQFIFDLFIILIWFLIF